MKSSKDVEIDVVFGALLETYIKSSGKTQIQIARDCGIRRETIYSIVKGRKCPDLPTLRKILSNLNLSVNEKSALLLASIGQTTSALNISNELNHPRL